MGEDRKLTEIKPGSADFDELVAFINHSGKAYADKYGFKVSVRRIWQVDLNDTLRQYEERAAALGRPTRLFHGTAVENAAQIIRHGFKMPKKHANGGMFGKGVYFADCPLKS